MSETGPLSDRMTQLELLVTHLQRDVEALNSVILEQRKEFDRLRRLLLQMDERLNRTTEDQPFDLKQEKPPHY